MTLVSEIFGFKNSSCVSSSTSILSSNEMSWIENPSSIKYKPNSVSSKFFKIEVITNGFSPIVYLQPVLIPFLSPTFLPSGVCQGQRIPSWLPCPCRAFDKVPSVEIAAEVSQSNATLPWKLCTSNWLLIPVLSGPIRLGSDQFPVFKQLIITL